MMGVIAFFAGLVIIGTVVDITINILNLDEVFSENFVQHFQGFSLYTNTIKLFHCPEPGAPGSLDCINGIRFGSDKRSFSCLTFDFASGPVFILVPVQVSFHVLGPHRPRLYNVAIRHLFEQHLGKR